LTNTHVVGNADEIEVHLEDGRILNATMIGADQKSDVAVIKVSAPHLPVLEMGNSKKIKIGQWVIAIGNPFGFSATLTAGVISATGRAGMGITDYEEFIQTDAAINPGNSGGPLLNTQGEVIGINTAIYSRSGGSMGIGFAIPINMALKIKDQLITYGEVHRSQLGVRIQDLTPAIAKSLGLKRRKGVLIVEVLPKSPAEKANLEAGDVVLELNGEPVISTAVFRNRISLHRPQDQVKLSVFRRKKRVSIDVQLASLDPSKRPQRRQAPTKDHSHRADEYGLEISEVSAKDQERLGLKRREGILVQHVVRDSVADQAGLQAGDVILSANQKRVRDIKSFKAVVKAARGSLLLHVIGQRGPRFIVLTK
jgi:serine protease Do